MRGPIDYIVIGFTGNKFNGSVLRALENAINQGTIGLVALSFIQKDNAGEITELNVVDLGDEYLIDFTEKYKPDTNHITSDDIDEVAELLDNDTAAGLLVIEQLWAKPLKKAILDVNGFLIAEGRIHPDAAEELNTQGEV